MLTPAAAGCCGAPSGEEEGTPVTDVDVRPAPTAGGVRTSRWASPLRQFGPAALLCVLALTLVSLHVTEYTRVGPIDELQHIDSLYKAPAVVAPGDKVGQDAMREESCRGVDFPMTVPPCTSGAEYSTSDFQENGYNTASGNTPVYYTVTKVLAALMAPFSPGSNLVTDGRLAGGLWLALGLTLTYAAGRRLGVPRAPLLAVLVLVGCAPSVLYPSATITPDAAGLAVGAGALLTVLWWEDRPMRRLPVLVLVVALGLTLKATNVMVFVALGAYLLLRLVDLQRGRREGTERGLSGTVTTSHVPLLLGGAAILVTFMVTQVGWTILQAGITTVDPQDVPMHRMAVIDGVPFAHFVEQLALMLNPLDSYLVEVGPPEYLTFVQRVPGYLLLAGLVASALFATTASRTRTLAQAVAIAAFTGGAAFVVLGWVTQGIYFPPPARYANSLVPAMVVVTAASLRTRTSLVVVTALAAAAVVVSVYRLTAF
jgi:hypothetical protein